MNPWFVVLSGNCHFVFRRKCYKPLFSSKFSSIITSIWVTYRHIYLIIHQLPTCNIKFRILFQYYLRLVLYSLLIHRLVNGTREACKLKTWTLWQWVYGDWLMIHGDWLNFKFKANHVFLHLFFLEGRVTLKEGSTTCRLTRQKNNQLGERSGSSLSFT